MKTTTKYKEGSLVKFFGAWKHYGIGIILKSPGENNSGNFRIQCFIVNNNNLEISPFVNFYFNPNHCALIEELTSL